MWFQERAIKFRAWDKETKEMWTDVLKEMGENDMYDDENSMWSVAYQMENPTDNEQFVFMQYALLKDKNKQDIYEGDVVRNHHNNALFVVKDMRMFYGFAHQNHVADYLEVIGNIFEHPELNTN